MKSGRDFPERCASAAYRWLELILAGMKIAAKIETHQRDGFLLLNVLCGPASPLVIGRKGQTLEAIQLLLTRILEQQCPCETGSQIVVDVEGYRERRRRNLLRQVRQTVEQVRESGEASSIEPLNPYERFIVHNTLKDEPHVTACSEGEGRLKRIVISPADK